MSLRNCFVLAIALTSLAFLIACGSSNSTTAPPSGAFSNSSFTGTYTFSILGSDTNGTSGSTLAMAGTLAPNGNGGFGSSTVDYVGALGLFPLAAIGSNSVYTVTPDGRGTARLFVTPQGATSSVEIDLDFVLTSSNHGLVSRFDNSGSGSGTIDSTSSGAALGGPYAFSVSGSDLVSNPLSAVGAATLDSSGNINVSGNNAGIADFDYKFQNPAYQAQALSGSITEGTPGNATLITPTFGTLTFDVWAVDSTHAKLIEIDGQFTTVGDLYSQGTDSIPNSGLVFSMAGLDPLNQAFVTGGTVTSDGVSGLTNGLQDINDDGTIDGNSNPLTPGSFSGNFVESPVGSGRFQVTLSGFSGGTVFVAYPSSGGILMLESDTTVNNGVTGGIALAQTSGAALGSTQGYGMNLTGLDVFNGGIELDEIGQFNTSGTTAVQTGNLDQNDSGSLGTVGLGGGTITVGPGGVGLINFNSSGLAGVLYYAADANTALVISADTGQVTVGSITQQSAPSNQAQVVQRHLAMVHAVSQARKSAKRGQKAFPVKH